MSVASIYRHPLFQRPRIEVLDQRAIIRDVAKRCLVELGVSLAIGAVSFFFTASLLHGALLFAAIAVQTICNAALRYARALAEREPQSEESRKIAAACAYLCPTTFAYLTAVNAQSLIHESGHAAAASLLFKEANPQITLTPCLGGLTRYSATHLSALGQKVGRSKTLLLVTLMGPVSTLFVSAVAMAVGLAIGGKFPELGTYLEGVGRGNFYAHAFYAVTALLSSPPSSAHDFVRLGSYGIHPLAAAIAILAVPILIHLAARASRKTEPQTA